MNGIFASIRREWPLHFALLFTGWLPDNVAFYRLRGAVAARSFGSCGRNLKIGRNLFVHQPRNLRLGDDVFMAYGCCLLANAEIIIEDEVLLAPYCVIGAGD